MSETTPTGGEIGRFELREKLRDGTPMVYRAYDVLYGREVRLKVYDSATTNLPLLIESHRRARELRHPAIVPVYEVGTAGEHCYVAGGAADGHRLSDELTDGPLAPRRAAVIARELAEGLARAHECGAVHGDIHTSGVALDPDHGAGWLDFGSSADDAPVNPAYVAPERLGSPPGPADTASDQYSLGVLLFEMLTGETPYIGSDDEVTAAVLAAETAPSARVLDDEISKDLDAVCRKALAPNPADRYATCQDFADDLRRWLEGDSVAARPPKRWLMTVLAGIVLLGLGVSGAGGLLVYYQRQQAMRLAIVAEQTARLAEAEARDRAEQARAATEQSKAASAVSHSDADKRKKEDAASRKRLEDELQKVRDSEKKLIAEKRKLEAQTKADAEARGRAERSLYCRYVTESYGQWRGRNLRSARSLLDAARPADRRPDYRGWEWYFLDRLYQPPKTFTLKLDASRLLNGDEPLSDQPRSCMAAYSPDGAMLAVFADDDRVTIWNRLTGTVAQTLAAHRGAVTGVAFSPDGRCLATCGVDRTVKLWEPASGQMKLSFRGLGGAPLDVAFALKGSAVAAGSDDKSVYVWDVASEERLHRLDGHEDKIVAVAGSKDDLIASGAHDGVIKLWDAKSGELRHTLSAHRGAVRFLRFSPDGSRLASCGSDGVIRLWDPLAGREQRALTGHASSVNAIAFRPDGKKLASVSSDTTVCQWDLDTGESTFFPSGQAGLSSVDYRPDGNQLVTAAFDRTVRLWDANRPVPLIERVLRGAGGPINAFAKAPNGKLLATAGRDKVVRLFDPASGETMRTLDDAEGPVRALAFTADGTNLVAAGDDKTARIYDVASGQLLRKIPHSAAIQAVAVTEDGKTLALAGSDGTTRLREFATGQAVLTLTNHSKAATSVAFSRDGRRVAVSGADGRLRLFDARTGAETAFAVRPVATPGEAFARGSVHPGCVAYNRSGRRLALGAGSGEIVVIDTTTMVPIKTLEGHAGRIHCLAFSPDTRRLASADADGVVKLWDAFTGLEVLRLPAHTGPICGMAWSNDGKSLYTAGEDRLVKVWDGSVAETKTPADEDRDDR